jgi:hypothetical protein
MTPVTRITVHHTAVEFKSTDEGVTAKAINGMQRYHQADLGWADIGSSIPRIR